MKRPYDRSATPGKVAKYLCVEIRLQHARWTEIPANLQTMTQLTHWQHVVTRLLVYCDQTLRLLTQNGIVS